jgi:hypothetical protein
VIEEIAGTSRIEILWHPRLPGFQSSNCADHGGSGFGRNAPRRKHRPLEFAVPELTRSADIKLNNGLSLQRRPERLVISRRTIFSPKGRPAHRQSRQANMPPLGGFVLKVASDAHRKS